MQPIASYRFAVMWKTSRRSQFIKSEDTTLPCPALPRPISAPSPPKYGFIKTTYGIYESAGPKAMLRCLGRPSRNGKQKMTKKRQQRTKRSADSGVGCWLGGGKGVGAKRRQGCLESFANLFKSGLLLNCYCCCCCLCCCCCCCHLAACNSFGC